MDNVNLGGGLTNILSLQVVKFINYEYWMKLRKGVSRFDRGFAMHGHWRLVIFALVCSATLHFCNYKFL